MIHLWRWMIVRRLFAERMRTSLTVLGVALGVAVFVSIRLASHSALASFSGTVDAVTGSANLQIVATAEGFDERAFPRLRNVPGVLAAAPVIETYALARPGGAAPPRDPRSDPGAPRPPRTARPYPETLMLLGLDLFREAPFARVDPRAAGASAGRGGASGGAADDEMRRAAVALLVDPRAVAITRTLATRHHLAAGDSLTVLSSGVPVTLRVALVLESQHLQQAMGGNVAILDIATAQELFHRTGRLDRIDLRVDPARRDAIRAALAARLPGGASVELPRSRTRQVENMVRAFGLNLTALSFIALFVATFLIFNAVGLSVLRWRREVGILRALGVTRAGVAALFVSEGAFLGVTGSVLGLGLGALLAKGTLLAIGRTLSDLYLVQTADVLRIDPATCVVGLGLGLVISLVSALAPALEAAATPPGVTIRQGILLEAQRLPIGRWTVAGGLVLALAVLVAVWTVREQRPMGGFVSAFLLLAGFSLVAPGFTLLGGRLAGPLMQRLGGIEGALGTRYLKEAVARTSVVVAALMVSVGMMVALSIMVGSFRRTVDTWIGQSIRGDLYIEPVGHRVNGSATELPPALIEGARRLPGVVAVDTYRGARITYGGRIAFAAGLDFDVQRRLGGLAFVGADEGDVLARALADHGVIVTESFAHHHHVRAGDVLALPTPTGVHRVRVYGVFYDYSTDAGGVLMDRGLFAQLWNDPRTESLALYLAKGASLDDVRRRFLVLAGPGRLMNATPNRVLRARVLTVFDETFQITYALQFIAIVVAVLGVIGTLTALILQRGREIGVLRATGALRSQVRKMVLFESGLLGLIGALLGCVAGVALAMLLIHVINRQFFGWTIRTTMDPWVFAEAIVLMVVAATLAGLGPAHLAAGRVAAEAMRVE